jgi:large subunit ribosomal protein L2
MKPIIPSYRYKLDVESYFFRQKKLKKISKKYLNNSGRNISGSVVLRGRSNKAIRRRAVVNYSNIRHKGIFLILGVFRQITNTVFLSLVKFGNGAVSFFALTHGAYSGKYRYFLYFRRFLMRNFFKSGSHVLIKLISNKTVFCQVTLRSDHSVKYIRAAGTYTRLYQRYRDFHAISCRLPTKRIKFLTYDALVVLGRNSNIKHRKKFLTKAGANILLGFKSKVRGVAMNPVDHPHGGRTKSNSPERSPWG